MASLTESTGSSERAADLKEDSVSAKDDSLIADKRNSPENDKEQDGTTTPPTKTLKRTTISDKDEVDHTMSESPEGKEGAPKGSTEQVASRGETTPEPSDTKDAEMREQIASPKKKRGRELDDDAQTPGEEEKVELEDGNANGSAVNGGRTTRSAPEKKRPRDTSVPPTTLAEDTPEAKSSDSKDEVLNSSAKSNIPDIPSTSSKPTPSNDKPQTSASAFASSGFGALSSKPSGFAALAGKPSVFGGGAAASTSGFGALTSNQGSTPGAPAAKLSFASAGPASSGFGSTGTTGFGGLSSGGSVFGGGFAASSGQKLSSFAAPAGKPTEIVGLAEKPAKAFGAPESDAEDGSEDEGEDGDDQPSDEEASVTAEEKKKSKLSKIPVDDGEAGETTLLQFRAKIFAIESKEKGWKERGVGTLKLNVPRSYVEYDDYTGLPIPGSYDPSGGVEEETEEGAPEPIAARLIMRQENTHRVILNTPIIKALKFEEKAAGSSMQILFTAFEEGKLINMLLRLSESNAKLLTSEIAIIQQEL